jgi:hypothetical protein
LSEAEIAKILELARAGWSVPEIVNETHHSENTIIKYIRKEGLNPRWTPSFSTEVGTPEQVHAQETEKPEPERVGIPQQPTRRHEGTTALSKSADELSDMARVLGNTAFIRDVMGGKPDPLDTIAKYGQLVRSEVAPMEQSLAMKGQEVKELRGQLAQAQVAAIQAESRIAVEQIKAQVDAMRLEMQGALERTKLELQLAAQDSWIGKMRFMEEAGQHYGLGDGRLRYELQSLASAAGVKVGGLVGQPQTLPAPPPKVLSVRPSVPRTEEDFEKISRRLERIEIEDSEHDQNRGGRLAQEVAMMKARIDELESTQSSAEPTRRELKVIMPTAHQKKIIEV